MKYASIGTVSHGTLRTEDLLDSFADELQWHVQFNAAELGAHRGIYLKLVGEANEIDRESEDAGEIVQELADALNDFAPPYCYFGAHEGDGSDFGFWPCIDQIDELPHLLEDAAGEFPSYSAIARHMGEDCKYVNDHGNVTVYGADGNVLLELV